MPEIKSKRLPALDQSNKGLLTGALGKNRLLSLNIVWFNLIKTPNVWSSLENVAS